METKKVLKLLRKYEECPKCGSTYIGNGQGTLIIETDYFIRGCKCGFEIKINAEEA